MANRAINICTYKVKPGKEAEMEELLRKHYPALLKAGLVDEEPPQIFRGLPDKHHGAEGVFVEIFAWKDPRGPEIAHETPEVMAVWEPMGAICEHMDFPSFEVLELHGAK